MAKKAYRGAGIDAKYVLISNTPTDYSPQVAQAVQGTDCVVGVGAEGHWTAWLPAMKQAGGHQRLIGGQGNFNPHVAERFPDMTENAISAGTYPLLSDPSLKLYRKIYEAARPPKSYDMTGLGAFGSWAALRIFTHIVEKIQGPVTNETFLAAASRTTAADSDGALPPLDFTKPLPMPGYKRLFNPYMTLAIVHHGRFYPYGSKRFIDVLPSWFGKKIRY